MAYASHSIRVFLVLSFLLSIVFAAPSINENENSLLQSRGNRGIGEGCGWRHKCSSGLYCSPKYKKCENLRGDGTFCQGNEQCQSNVCFAKACQGQTNRPLGAPCQDDNNCSSSAFCRHPKNGHPAYCKTKSNSGESCSRNSVCQSNSCDLKSKKCSSPTTTSTSSPITSPTTSPPSTNSQLSSAANSAIANVQPLSNGQAYYSSTGPLSNVPGTIATLGQVSLTTLSNGRSEIVLKADVNDPAAIKDTLTNPIQRRLINLQKRDTNIFQFQYNVNSFSANPSTSICQIVPSVNGNNLSPVINITSGTQSGTVNYIINGAVSNFATALVCSEGASAQVTYPSMTVQSENTQTSSTTTSSTTYAPSTTTSSTTIAPSSTSSRTIFTSSSTSMSTTISPTSSPIFQYLCSGSNMINCGFETGSFSPWTFSSTVGNCDVTSSVKHTGYFGAHCSFTNAIYGSDGFYLNQQNFANQIVNQSYTMSFYAKTPLNNTILFCNLNDNVDEDTESNSQFQLDQISGYNGDCNKVGSPDVNGWQQYTFNYKAGYNSMTFSVGITGFKYGDYYFDDFSLVPFTPGAATSPSAQSSTTPLTSLPPTSTSTRTPSTSTTISSTTPLTSLPPSSTSTRISSTSTSTSSTSTSTSTPTITTPSQCTGSDIFNCGFESDSLSPWVYTDQVGICEVTNSVVHSGNYAAHCQSYDHPQNQYNLFLNQTISNQNVGQSYTMNFYAITPYTISSNQSFASGTSDLNCIMIDSTDGSTETVSDQNSSYNGICNPIGTPNSAGWLQYTFTYTAKFDSEMFSVYNAGLQSGDYYFDDFTLVPGQIQVVNI